MIDHIELTTMTPDPDRAARVAAKCRKRMQINQTRAADIERAVVAGVSLAYMISVLGIAFRVFAQRLS